jgi:hypothetical protein
MENEHSTQPTTQSNFKVKLNAELFGTRNSEKKCYHSNLKKVSDNLTGK